MLKLPPDIQVALRDGLISMGHARAIINIENVDLQLDLFKRIIKEQLSVRKVEQLVRAGLQQNQTKNTTADESGVSNEINKLQTRLVSHFGTKVSVKANKENKGEIKIPFTSADDLNRILDILDI